MRKLSAAVTLALALSTQAFAGDVSEIWKGKCKNCHGETGKADTNNGRKEKIKDMTTDEWQTKWTDEKIVDVIANGSKDNKKMKPFKEKLSHEEIQDLVKYIRAFKK